MKEQRFRLLAGLPDLHEDGFTPRGRRGDICFFGKGGGSAPAPDPMIGVAAMGNVDLGNKWLQFAKDQFAEGNKRQEVTDALTGKVINQQLDAATEAQKWAEEDRARTKDTFQPLEDQFIQQAKDYGSEAKQAEAAATAKADAATAAAGQQAASQRTMASMGVNPASGRFAGITRANDTALALGTAGAQNAARIATRDKGLALTADAINIGKGLPSSTASSMGLGLNAGNSAVGNNQSANNNFYQNGSVMAQGFAGNMQGNSSAGSILNNLYGNQISAWGAQQQANATSAAGLGSMFGTIAGAGITAF
jgi:hypothetical protein